MVELVIKIPERVYNALTHTEFDANLVVNEMRKSIANGMLLPKGHGRLIDGNELWEKMYRYTDNEGAKMPFGDDDSLIHKDSACFLIENAPTILEEQPEVPIKEVVKDYISATYGDISDL